MKNVKQTKQKRKSKIFLLHVRITYGSWHYKTDQIIIVPVYAWSAYHAEEKFTNERWGSEYPTYRIVKIEQCDNSLFCPILPGLKMLYEK